MDDKQKQSMGELAALMYEDPDFKVPEGMTLKAAMDAYAEQRFPGTQARIAAQKISAQAQVDIAKQREEFRKELEAEKAARARQKALDEIKSDPNLKIRDDEIPAIEKVMAERYVGTYKDAATLYRGENRVAAPRRTSASMEMPGMSGGGGAEFDWLKPAWVNRDGSVLDKVTNRRVAEILDDFDRDPNGAAIKWA
jgi:hypothetical protein